MNTNAYNWVGQLAKLPPAWSYPEDTPESYATKCVEQATAELAAEIARLRAELDRLTTLRPCSEWKQGEEVIWHFAQRPLILLSRNYCGNGALGWTYPYIPDVKETK